MMMQATTQLSASNYEDAINRATEKFDKLFGEFGYEITDAEANSIRTTMDEIIGWQFTFTAESGG